MLSKLEHLERFSRNVGPEINIKKTKAMRINNTRTEHIMLQGQIVEYVDSFCYLCSTMTTNGGAQTDVHKRLNSARAAFGRLHSVWSSSYISRRTKLKIFNACVKSTLLYSSETCFISNTFTQKLQVFFNKCLRIVCRIFWTNISKADLWTLTEEQPIQKKIKQKKWGWIGHTLRKKPDDRMTLEWNPQGSRNRGRLKKHLAMHGLTGTNAWSKEG